MAALPSYQNRSGSDHFDEASAADVITGCFRVPLKRRKSKSTINRKIFHGGPYDLNKLAAASRISHLTPHIKVEGRRHVLR